MKKELVALGELAREIKLKEDQSKVNTTAEKDEDEIMIIDDDDLPSDLKTTKTATKHEISKIKGKLLQFHENYRPAYFGSWRKKSSKVGSRTPLKKDEVCQLLWFSGVKADFHSGKSMGSDVGTKLTPRFGYGYQFSVPV